MTASELLSLHAAAREVGWEGTDTALRERMQRLLESKERTAGVEIMTRLGKRGSKGTRYRITMAALRRWCPEFFESHVDELARGFRRVLEGIDAKIDRKIENHPTIRELWARDEVVAETVREIMTRLDRMA